jgi:hypothetical protein
LLGGSVRRDAEARAAAREERYRRRARNDDEEQGVCADAHSVIVRTLLRSLALRKSHLAAAITVALLPLVGFFAGTRGLAFTMYAESVWFRIDLVAMGADGLPHTIAPTALAPHVGPSASPFFAGSDHYRRTYDVTPLRQQLEEVARLACRVEGGRAVSVEVTLFERRSHGVRETRSNVKCGA